MATQHYSQDGIEVWQGNCLDHDDVRAVMGDRVANMMCVDAPYSERTHAGHADGKMTADRAAGFDVDSPVGNYARKVASGLKVRRDIDYAAWTEEDVQEFSAQWDPFVDGWWASLTDHVLQRHWEAKLQSVCGLYVFPPLPWVEVGSRVRMLGDGPSGWTCWLVLGRPRRKPFSKWGTTPGAYVMPGENHQNRPGRRMGGKSIEGTCSLIEDYSKRGELVVDPAGGGGTTAVACRMTGRRCITMDSDPAAVIDMIRALEHGARRLPEAKQETLW